MLTTAPIDDASTNEADQTGCKCQSNETSSHRGYWRYILDLIERRAGRYSQGRYQKYTSFSRVSDGIPVTLILPSPQPPMDEMTNKSSLPTPIAFKGAMVKLPSTDVHSASASSLVQQLVDLKPSSPEFRELLRSILFGKNYADFSASLKGHEALDFIDILDQALDSVPQETDLYQKSLRALRKICGQTKLLPTTHMLSDGLEKMGDMPSASGGFADVWKGTYKDGQVAIKSLRIYNTDDLQLVKKLFCKEVVIWRRLSHPNILPFLGVSTSVFRLAMVSEWMPHGNISHYIATHPQANCLQLLLDVANGLQFLHKSQVVHGDLKGPNILINNQERACLADFGLASITSDPLSVNASTAGATHGSARWMAPELLNPEHPDQDINRPTEASDIYALGMVIIEVFGGRVPFHEFRNEVVIFKVMAGMRPDRPTNTLMSDELWDVVQSCWLEDPAQRPKISEVLGCLERAGSPSDQRTLVAPAILAPVLSKSTLPERRPSPLPKVEQFTSHPAVSTRQSPSVMDRIAHTFRMIFSKIPIC